MKGMKYEAGREREGSCWKLWKNGYVRKILENSTCTGDIARRDAPFWSRLHPNTVLQIIRFVEFVTSHPDCPRFITYWFEAFRRYCQERGER